MLLHCTVTGDGTAALAAGDRKTMMPPLQLFVAGGMVNVDVADFTSGQPAKEATTDHDVVPAGTMRVSSWSVVSPAESEPRKRVYFVAPGTSVHWNSTGDVTFVAPFAGETSVGAALLHVVAVVTANADAAENVEGQLSKRASTSQFTAPCGTATGSDVVVGLPRTWPDVVAPVPRG